MISGRGPYHPASDDDDRLLTYPYIVVRLECATCKKSRRFRLARLAEEFGSDITMPRLLDRLTINCVWRRVHDYKGRFKGREGDEPCRARFIDLEGPRPPPDLPPGASAPPDLGPNVFDIHESAREIKRRRRAMRG